LLSDESGGKIPKIQDLINQLNKNIKVEPNSIKIENFIRWECGEGIESNKVSFAEEVAAKLSEYGKK